MDNTEIRRDIQGKQNRQMPDEKAGEAQHLCVRQSSKGSGEGVKRNRHTVGISADPWDPTPMISNTFSAHA